MIFITASWAVNNEDIQKTTLLSVTKLWVVIGCIIALLVVAVMQAGCTIYKTMHSTGSKHKVVNSNFWVLFNQTMIHKTKTKIY